MDNMITRPISIKISIRKIVYDYLERRRKLIGKISLENMINEIIESWVAEEKSRDRLTRYEDTNEK